MNGKMVIKVNRIIYDDTIMKKILIAKEVQSLCTSLSIWISDYDKKTYSISEKYTSILEKYNFEILDRALIILDSKNKYNKQESVKDLYEYLYKKINSIDKKLNQPLDFIRNTYYDYHDLSNYIVIEKNKLYGVMCKFEEKYYSDSIQTAVDKLIDGFSILRHRLNNNYARIEAGQKLYNFIVSLRDMCIFVLDSMEIEFDC